MGGGYRRGWGGGAPGGSVGGGVQVGQFGVVGGGPGGAIWGVGGGRGAQAPLTSPCPPSNLDIFRNAMDLNSSMEEFVCPAAMNTDKQVRQVSAGVKNSCGRC